MDRPDGSPPLMPTGTRDGWRLPALAVLALLVGLVALTRWDGPDLTPPPTRVLGPSAAAAVATPDGTPAPTPRPNAVSRLSGVMPRSPDGLTYADGIPTGISGEPVYRVRDALLVPLGRTVLVGGWYLSRTCRPDVRTHCPAPTMSDVPLDAAQRDLATNFVALDEPLHGTGAHIVLATIEPDPGCSISGMGACQPRLRVLQQIWSGPEIAIR
jgi:hypothetical protein